MTKLTATDILELQYKAINLGYDCFVYERDDGYEIEINLFNGKGPERVFINNENESTWQGDYDYDTMMNVFNQELEKQKQKEEKAKKRKELINSLTPEQRELLGF